MRITLLLAVLALTACGGSGDEPETAVQETTSPTAAKAEKHLLSAEQELMQQAKEVEGLLNDAAEERKKALEAELGN